MDFVLTHQDLIQNNSHSFVEHFNAEAGISAAIMNYFKLSSLSNEYINYILVVFCHIRFFFIWISTFSPLLLHLHLHLVI